MYILDSVGIQDGNLDRLDAAYDLYERYASFLSGDPTFRSLLASYRTCLDATAACIQRIGLADLCAQCETEQGGSCCGAGIEREYDATLLMLNLLLGARPRGDRLDSRSCLFLGRHGCGLPARHVLCVNYLCARVADAVPREDRIRLQQASGEELDTQFRLIEHMHRLLERAESLLDRTMRAIEAYYDGRKAGVAGGEGYRKSTDLASLAGCLPELVRMKILRPRSTVFLDLGCADGRVNVYMSYWARVSLGIELDESILAEAEPLRRNLEKRLEAQGLPKPPERIRLRLGDSLSPAAYANLYKTSGYGFADVDAFYTHFTLHDVFADRIAREAKPGAAYLVYGLDKVVPKYPGLEPLYPDGALNNVLGVYVKGAVPVHGTPCGEAVPLGRSSEGAPQVSG